MHYEREMPWLGIKQGVKEKLNALRKTHGRESS